jgi:PAS domain-containing protein/DNA-binding CsgD family transcriptional regulator
VRRRTREVGWEEVTPDDMAGSPWTELLAGAAVVHQQALSKLRVPALIMDLPNRRIRAANQALADLYAVPVPEIVGRVNSEVVEFDDVEAMKRALDAVSSGAIDGYRARRRITPRGGVARDVVVWCRAVELDGARSAVFIVEPITDRRKANAQLEAPIAWAGPLVVGTADPEWRVERVSSDVVELLGWDAGAYIHHSLLSSMHADDARELVQAVRSSSLDGALARHVRLRHRNGGWVAAECIFVRLSDDDPPAVAFTLLPEPPSLPSAPADRLLEMEHRLRRIASELRAAGVMEDIDGLPTYDEFPQLTTLTSRQWQVLVRLLRGDRVPTIASELFLSPRTIRNYLAAIFERFNVHSQAELIALLKPR